MQRSNQPPAPARYPPHTYISTFLASKYLGIPAFELAELVRQGALKTYTVDKYGEKFLVRDLDALRRESLIEHPAASPAVNVTAGTAQQEPVMPGPAPVQATAPEAGAPPDYDMLIALHCTPLQEEAYVEIPPDCAGLIEHIPLYYRPAKDNFQIYKNAGTTLSRERVDTAKHPALFMRQTDVTQGHSDIHIGLCAVLDAALESGDAGGMQDALERIVANGASHSDGRIVRALAQTVRSVIDACAGSEVLQAARPKAAAANGRLANHSVNVFLLAVRFCLLNRYSADNTFQIVLSALLHDIGMARLPPEAAGCEDRGDQDAREIYRCHPILGMRIIEGSDAAFTLIGRGALEHHERLDGSGFPHGMKKLSFFGQLLGIMDVYERTLFSTSTLVQAGTMLDTLRTMKEEVAAGRFNRELFGQFAYSLSSGAREGPA